MLPMFVRGVALALPGVHSTNGQWYWEHRVELDKSGESGHRERSPIGPTKDTSPSMFAVWELTTRCNLACKYCHVKGNSSGPAPDTIRDAALRMKSEFCERHGLCVFWTGGEPTLRPDVVVDLAPQLAGGGIRLGLCTNGTTLGNASIRRAICEYYQKITVSLDSSGVPDRLRPGYSPGRIWQSLEKVCHDRAGGRGLVVSVAVTLSKANTHLVRDICKRARDIGVDRIEMRPLQCDPRDKAKVAYALDRRDITFLQSLPSLRAEFGSSPMIDAPDAYLDRIWRYVSGSLDGPVKCVAGYSIIFVDSQLEVFPCCSFFPRTQGIPLHEWLSGSPESMRRSVRRIIRQTIPNGCARCLDMANLEIAAESRMLEE